jgi:hypothetical protein
MLVYVHMGRHMKPCIFVSPALMEATVTNVLSLTLAILSVWPATMWIDRALQAEAAAALCDREIPLVRGPTSNLPPPMLKLAGFEVPCAMRR